MFESGIPQRDYSTIKPGVQSLNSRRVAAIPAALAAMDRVAGALTPDPLSELWGRRSVVAVAGFVGCATLAAASAERAFELVREDCHYGFSERSIDTAEELFRFGHAEVGTRIPEFKVGHWNCSQQARFFLARGAARLRAGDDKGTRDIALGVETAEKFKTVRNERFGTSDREREIIHLAQGLAAAGEIDKARDWANCAGSYRAGISRCVLLEALRQGKIKYGPEIAAAIGSEGFKFDFMLAAGDWLHREGCIEEARQAIGDAERIEEGLDRHRLAIRLCRLLDLSKAWGSLAPAKALASINNAEECAAEIDRDIESAENPPGWLVFDWRRAPIQIAQAYAAIHDKDASLKFFNAALQRCETDFCRADVADAMAEAGFLEQLRPMQHLFLRPENKALYPALMGLAAVKNGDSDLAVESFARAGELGTKIPRRRETAGLPWNDLMEVLARSVLHDRDDVSISSRWSGSVVAFK